MSKLLGFNKALGPEKICNELLKIGTVNDRLSAAAIITFSLLKENYGSNTEGNIERIK